MRKKLWNRGFSIENLMRRFFKEENGETNIIAIILIIIVVIALVGLFRTQLEGIIGGLFGQIKGQLGLPE